MNLGGFQKPLETPSLRLWAEYSARWWIYSSSMKNRHSNYSSNQFNCNILYFYEYHDFSNCSHNFINSSLDSSNSSLNSSNQFSNTCSIASWCFDLSYLFWGGLAIR